MAMIVRTSSDYWELAGMDDRASFELEVLGMVADDYEAPHTISSDLARELGRPVAEGDVRTALLALVEQGLVQAYVYEPSSRRYRSIPAADARSTKEVWFMVNASGLRKLEHHAS
jgi:hypothetical protein